MHRYIRKPGLPARHVLRAVSPSTGNSLRDWLRVEPSGVRTACAAIIPFVLGQMVGQGGVGLLIGLGGLYLSVVDKNGARLPTLLLTVLGIFLAALAGGEVAGHPALDVPLMFCWAFALGLLAAYGPVAANVGFVMTLVYAVSQGMAAAPPDEQWTRALLFGFGGLWSIVATLVLWRIAGPTSPNVPPTEPCPEEQASRNARDGFGALIGRLGCHLTVSSPVLLHALRLGIVATVAVALQKGLRMEHGHWIVITSLVIVKPDYRSTRARALERMAGSAIGGIAAVLLVSVVRSTVAMDGLLVILCVLAYSHVQRSYGIYTVLLTPFIILMLNIGHPGDWQLALVRVGDTLVGGALALTVAVLLRPERDPVELNPPDPPSAPKEPAVTAAAG